MNDKKQKAKKMCSEGCRHCVYIGEGEFYCDLFHIIVGEGFVIDTLCLKEDQKHER